MVFVITIWTALWVFPTPHYNGAAWMNSEGAGEEPGEEPVLRGFMSSEETDHLVLSHIYATF